MQLPRRAIGCTVGAGLIMVTALSATAGRPPAAIFQLNVQNDPSFRGGEPEIAVNPLDHRNMVMTWAAMQNISVEGQHYPGLLAQFASVVTGMQTIQCQISYTVDGGLHWNPVPVPRGDKPACGDPMVVADDNGGFTVAFDRMGSSLTPNTEGTQLTDQVAVSRSSDGGRTWSAPVDVGTIVDRPFLRIDRPSGWLYEVSGGLLSASARKLTISRDRGRTWSPPVAFPSNHLAVNRGTLATALQSGNPSQLGFSLSTDSGQTFTQSPVTGATPGGTGDWITADPGRAGAFSVMQQVGDTLEILTTSDAGRSWSPPQRLSVAGRGVALPWLDYGPTGVLGVMWKATDATTGQFVVEVAARRVATGGFTAPVIVSSAASAGSDLAEEGAGDDLSWITVDTTGLYLGWGDRRSGTLQAWFAKVPLASL